ncbi:MAG TPA: 4-(cytidine 5'-diphospho)-2-C-methyl-D-erythritol kinase [Acidobacteriaceae bacterium]|nr:4-(cytidine 5'-diphospho)-2-C-methyl-D-erythritol kinase [Acidobacteriaceae bacterium]
MPTTLRSFCKINLGLAIGPPRADGFHSLATCYLTLAAHDLVTVTASPSALTAIRLATTDERVPTDSRNTAWKMAERALAAMSVSAEVHIHIEKRLPVQGGIGAGSANAVAALLGLEAELGRRLSDSERFRIAAAVGSDVPLFLVGGAVLGTGRGEQVTPFQDFGTVPCVLALPDVGISTPQAYRDWDELQGFGQRAQGSDQPSAVSSEENPAHQQPGGSSGLTAPHPSDRLTMLSRALSAALGPGSTNSSGVSAMGGNLASLEALVRTGIENDFEEVVFRQHPFLGTIKRILAAPDRAEEAALCAALSGSGSALFGLYRTPAAAQAAEERLAKEGIRSLRTETLPRAKYWELLSEKSC